MEEIVLSEALGFHGIWVSEHHGLGDAYLPAPFTVLGAIAARTRRLRLGTNILLLPLWPIRLVAEQTAVLDLISEGRVNLGLGLGYAEHEFAAFGLPRSQRRARMEAGIPYLRAAFRGEGVPDGPHGTTLPVAPLPAQGEALPIYLAGEAAPALERAARLGDGFLAAANFDVQHELPAQWRVLRPYLEMHGRDVASFPIVASTQLWVSDDPERDFAEWLAPAIAYQAGVYEIIGTDHGLPRPNPPSASAYRRSDFLIGTPDEVIAGIKTLQSTVPVSEICFWSHLPGVPHDAAAANLERLARHVLPAFA
jgi:alkanesulfonate monooxygenase SsuD/methylene tetrahydromethanopterin reductase-like flavin-dependent oxidoreductase (luciferase family)